MIKLYAKPDFSERRIKAGHSVATLAKASGVTPGAIRHYEARVNGIKPAVAMKICEALGAELPELFDMIDNKTKK